MNGSGSKASIPGTDGEMKIEWQDHGSAPLDEAEDYLRRLVQARRDGTAAAGASRPSVLVLSRTGEREMTFTTLRYAPCPA